MIIFVSMAKGLFVIYLAMKFIKSKNICQKENKHIFLPNNRGPARIYSTGKKFRNFLKKH